MSTFTAAMVYMARAQLQSVGRRDREEYLEERLAVHKIAFAGIQNGSWATLVPMGIDTGRTAFGQDGWFNTRSSDQASDIWGGSPTIGFLNDAAKLPETFVDFVNGDATQADARKAFSLVYLQNNLIIANLFSTLVSPLPLR